MAAGLRIILGIALACLFAAATASAETWPRQTVRVIVPLPAGTGTDIAARLYAERLSQRWGQPVIVENRPGADGIIAAQALVNARDNHTLLFSFAGLITINPLIHDKLPYDPARDLVPIAPGADNFFAIAISEKLGIKTLAELIALARAKPGKLNWAATPGLPQFIFAALAKSAGLQMIEVSYKDFTPALQDLGEGRIEVAVTGLALFLPHVQAGRVRLLMVTNRERAPVAPGVPTASEVGHPELTFEGTVGFYGWRGMPDELRDRIAGDARTIAADPVVGARIASVGSLVRTGTPAEFAAAIEEQRVKVAAIGRPKPAQ